MTKLLNGIDYSTLGINQNLDVRLSTRASEETVTNIYGLLSNVLDSALSNLATENTLSNISDNIDTPLSSIATDISTIKSQTDKLTFDTNNLLKINLTGNDIGIATEKTATNIYGLLSNVLDSTLSNLATEDTLSNISDNIDIPLSSIGTDISSIKSQTDKLTFDTNNLLKINLAGNDIGIATETTLSSILTQLNISLTELRDALLSKEQIYQQLINADESVSQSITLDTKGHQLVDIYASSTTATTFKVELSNDNTNWIPYYSSASSETEYKNTIQTAFKYVKLSSTAAGTSGTDTVTLILCAK